MNRKEFDDARAENPRAVLGQAVLVMGAVGQVETALLTGFDESNNSYRGVIFYNNSFVDIPYVGGSNIPSHPTSKGSQEKKVRFAICEFISGLRAYPDSRPNYAFQFILPGEDVNTLLTLASGNAGLPAPNAEEGDVVSTEGGGSNAPNTSPLPKVEEEKEFDPRDTNKDGTVSAKEQKRWDKSH